MPIVIPINYFLTDSDGKFSKKKKPKALQRTLQSISCGQLRLNNNFRALICRHFVGLHRLLKVQETRVQTKVSKNEYSTVNTARVLNTCKGLGDRGP